MTRRVGAERWTTQLLASMLRAKPSLLREPILTEDLDTAARSQPAPHYLEAVKRWRALLATDDVDVVIAAMETADEPLRTMCPLDVLLLTPRGEL